VWLIAVLQCFESPVKVKLELVLFIESFTITLKTSAINRSLRISALTGALDDSPPDLNLSLLNDFYLLLIQRITDSLRIENLHAALALSRITLKLTQNHNSPILDFHSTFKSVFDF
jgi:hypothetical protein